MQKNDICEIEANDLTIEGKAVGRADGMAVFVNGLLPGERGRARVAKTAKNYAEAELLERLSDSSDRVLPPCP